MTNYSFFKASRSWGNEYIIAIVPSFYTVKILEIYAGHKGGLQYHHFKSECGFILQGKLKINTIDSSDNPRSMILKKGDFFNFPPKKIHQEEALEDTIIIEVSTPHFNDRHRLDTDRNNSLQSTLPHQVVKIDQLAHVARLDELSFEKVNKDQVPYVNIVDLFF